MAYADEYNKRDAEVDKDIRAVAISAAATRLSGNDWARQRVGLVAEIKPAAMETVLLAEYFVKYINTGSIT